ncbi:MAG TPA: NIPSNAP family protein [Candidatus Limnocylindria bacterium]|nr:NIPSNAP family protein [Candidatus Limnocylindria bacterium]
MQRFVEIRSYNLKPGSRDEFHRLVTQASLPLLERWYVDVVAYGPSPHDDVSYFLIRSYDSLEHRRFSQEAFYGSPDWLQGPREAIVSLIEKRYLDRSRAGCHGRECSPKRLNQTERAGWTSSSTSVWTGVAWFAPAPSAIVLRFAAHG